VAIGVLAVLLEELKHLFIVPNGRELHLAAGEYAVVQSFGALLDPILQLLVFEVHKDGVAPQWLAVVKGAAFEFPHRPLYLDSLVVLEEGVPNVSSHRDVVVILVLLLVDYGV
jgi:hypothetical protein